MNTHSRSSRDWIRCLALLLVVAGCSALEAAAPNILLIVADDLGYSDLGCYGGEIRTPNIDGLAARGERHTQFYNIGRCCPSRASILTGHYPHRVGLGHMTQDLQLPGYRGRVDSNFPTVAQRLQDASYRSFLSGKWHLGVPDPTRFGFEEFFGTLVSAKTFWDPDHFVRLPAGRQRRRYDPSEFYGTDALGDYAIEFLRQANETPDRPWFLYLAFNAPHFPLHARPADIRKYKGKYDQGWDALRTERFERMKQLGVLSKESQLSQRGVYWDWGERSERPIPSWESLPSDRRGDLARRMEIYAAMVEVMDRNVGRVLDQVKRQGDNERTLIWFLSDNGACAEWDPFGFDIRSSRNNTLHWDDQLPKMGQPGTFHSVGSGWANASNTPWRLFKHFNHEGGIASPAIIVRPGQSDGGSINRHPAHIVDIAPTLLNAAGVAPDAALPGADLFGKVDPDRTLYFEHQGNRAVREGKWKLVALRGREWQLHDMTRDRIESQDLADQHPVIVRTLAEKWESWAKKNFVTPFPKDYRVGYWPPETSANDSETLQKGAESRKN